MQFKPDIERFVDPSFRLIEAGAGSGKTFNLEFIVLRLIAEKGKRASEILMVTFTDAAAMEMRQRVRDRLKLVDDKKSMAELLDREAAGSLNDSKLAELNMIKSIMAFGVPELHAERMARVSAAVNELYRLRITTIHGFCQHVLSEHGPNHGFPPLSSAPVPPAELVDEIASDWYRSQMARWPLGECSLAIKALLSDPLCDVRLLFRGVRIDPNDPRPKKNGDAGKARFEVWEKAADARFASQAGVLQDQLRAFVTTRLALTNIVTFEDLILRLKAALFENSERSKALTKSVRDTYSCCLIDEFQDTDDAQWSIFSHLFQPSADDEGSKGMLLVAVGDPKQAIYSFRGADIRTYQQAREQASDGIVHTLDFNFRTDPTVIAAFNQLFSLPEYFADKKLVYTPALPAPGAKDVLSRLTKDAQHQPPVHVVPSIAAVQVPKEVARMLNDLDAAGVVGGTVGVLVRGNAEADELHRQLVKCGLPAALESTQSVFATQAAYIALLLLRAVLYHEDVRARRALIYARPSLFGDLSSKLSGDNADTELQAVDTALADWIAQVHRDWTKYGFTSCWSRLTRIAPDNLECVQQSLARALFRSRLLVDFSHVGELLAARQRENLWDPHQVVAHLEAKISSASTMEDEDAALDESLRAESEKPRIVVQTIHRSKGLEYGAVLLYLKQSDGPRGYSGIVLKADCTGTRQLILGSTKDMSEATVEAIEAQILQENARLLYVAITRAKHRLVVMTKKTAAKDGLAGFHEVLSKAGLNPFTLSPNVVGQLEASSDEQKPSPAKLQGWNPDFIGQVALAEATYVAEKVSGPEFNKAAEGLRSVPSALGATNFTALTKHQEFPKEYLPGQEDTQGGPRGPVVQDPAKEDILLGSSAKGALFGVFIHELLDGLNFAKAVEGKLSDDRPLQDHVLDCLVASGVPATEGDPRHTRMAAQVTDSCKLWLSAQLPAIDGVDAAPFSLKDIDKDQILSEIRFALRSCMASESVGGIKALFMREFSTHYPKFGDKVSPLVGVTMSKKQVDGLLTGVADLIFLHKNRFYIVDWKTNFLGNQVAQYDRTTVDLEMAESFYHLQYSLYTVALDAYLAQSMGDSWSYDSPKDGAAKPGTASFGGVYYLFLRAFGHKGRGDIGCHHYRPTKDFINELRLQLASPVNLTVKPKK